MTDDICISVNEVSYPILCGTCKQPVAFIGEANADSGDVGCTACGNITDVQEVARLTLDYAKDEGQMIVNRLARDAARKSKIMSFSGQTTHNKVHRFIVDLKL